MFSEEHKRKIGKASLGRKHTEEAKRKVSNAQKGNKHWLGKHHSEETRRKIGRRGEESPNWRGGKTPVNRAIRQSLEYKLWREAIFKRDNYTCVWCGERGGKLNADHIKPFVDYPELRFALDNGRTLCIECHKKTDTWGWKGYWKNYKN